MRIVQAMLREVADDVQLQHQGDLTLPLLGLAESYNKHAKRSDDFFEITEQSTGRELKIALAGVPLRNKLVLLYLYKDHCQRLLCARSSHHAVKLDSSQLARLEELEREEQIKFRALVRRTLLVVVAPLPPLVAGAMVTIAVHKGLLADSGLADTLIATAAEILKLIFES